MLALVTDLIFATKIISTAKSLGVEIKTVRSLEKLDERLATGVDRLALIDLNADGVDVVAAIDSCHRAAHRPRIIAYVSHIQADLIEAARQAGADEGDLPSKPENGVTSITAKDKKRQRTVGLENVLSGTPG